MGRDLVKYVYNETESRDYNISGWVTGKRDLGKKAFLIVKDRSGDIQTVLTENGDLKEKYDSINIGDVINLRGESREDERAPGGKEIDLNYLEVINRCEYPTPIPLDHEKRVGKESDINLRLDNRFLDLRNDDMSDIFKIKAKTIYKIRDELDTNDFVEVQTPKIVAQATEGGSNLFPIEYFEKDAFLAQSPQFYKQMLMASGLERVYEIAPCFRAERHGTIQHLNEFTSIDFEMAFIENEEDVMKMIENMLHYVITDVEYYARQINSKYEIEVPEPPFPRVTMEEAYKILEDNGIHKYVGEEIGSAGEKVIGEYIKDTTGSDFYFLTEYAKDCRALYAMPHEEKPDYTRSFDLIYKGTEIVTGGQRIHDYDMLREAFEQRGHNPDDYDFYINAFRYGMPKHGGMGLGLDRLVSKLLDLENIREVVLFPRDKNRIRP